MQPLSEQRRPLNLRLKSLCGETQHTHRDSALDGLSVELLCSPNPVNTELTVASINSRLAGANPVTSVILKRVSNSPKSSTVRLTERIEIESAY